MTAPLRPFPGVLEHVGHVPTRSLTASAFDDERSVVDNLYEFAQKQQDCTLGNVGSYQITKHERDFIPVGAGGLRAPRVIWHTPTKRLGGEWVFFQSRQRSVMWLIIWYNHEGYDEATFRQVLSSFRWLDEAFFRSLPR